MPLLVPSDQVVLMAVLLPGSLHSVGCYDSAFKRWKKTNLDNLPSTSMHMRAVSSCETDKTNNG
jgi:hypothetical protein